MAGACASLARGSQEDLRLVPKHRWVPAAQQGSRADRGSQDMVGAAVLPGDLSPSPGAAVSPSDSHGLYFRDTWHSQGTLRVTMLSPACSAAVAAASLPVP